MTEWKRLLAIVSCLACAGCGSAFFNHEIDLIFEGWPRDLPPEARAIAIGPIYHNDRSEFGVPSHFPDSNACIRINQRDQSCTWLWEQRPHYYEFNLYIPAASTNGFYGVRFSETSKLPWRGLKTGSVPVTVCYYDFTTWHKTRVPVAFPPADVSPIEGSGFRFMLHVPATMARTQGGQK